MAECRPVFVGSNGTAYSGHASFFHARPGYPIIGSHSSFKHER